MTFVITHEDAEGDEVTPVATAVTRDEAKAWIVIMAAKEGYEADPVTFTEGADIDDLVAPGSDEGVIWDWNPADDAYDPGFAAVGMGSGPFHYRITEVPSA